MLRENRLNIVMGETFQDNVWHLLPPVWVDVCLNCARSVGPVKIRFAPFQDPSQLEGQHSVSAISGAVIDNDVEGVFFF